MVERQSKFITDKRDISQKIIGKDLLNKKPVKNPKYEGVKSNIDTGKSIKKVVMQSDQLVSKRRSELFKRVKGGAIIKLLDDVVLHESIYNLGNQDKVNEENINVNNVNADKVSTISYKSNQNSSITQVTSSSQIVGDLSKITKFVIVDLREPVEYEEFHIKEAINMPYFNISRDKYPNEVYLIKNQMDKMIIAYGFDERNSVSHCQLLFQKGFDNIYMLSGGIEEFVKAHPNYCEGVGLAKVIHEMNQLKSKSTKQVLNENNITGGSLMKSDKNSMLSNNTSSQIVNKQMPTNSINGDKQSVTKGLGNKIVNKENDEFDNLKRNLAKK